MFNKKLKPTTLQQHCGVVSAMLPLIAPWRSCGGCCTLRGMNGSGCCGFPLSVYCGNRNGGFASWSAMRPTGCLSAAGAFAPCGALCPGDRLQDVGDSAPGMAACRFRSACRLAGPGHDQERRGSGYPTQPGCGPHPAVSLWCPPGVGVYLPGQNAWMRWDRRGNAL